MKNKILLIVLVAIVVVCIIALSGCISTTSNNQPILYNSQYCRLVIIENNLQYQILVDSNTKVMYVYLISGYQGGLSPIYNADGTLKLYEGEL